MKNQRYILIFSLIAVSLIIIAGYSMLTGFIVGEIGGTPLREGVEQEWITESFEVTMEANDLVKFRFNDELHEIRLMAIGYDYVVLWMYSGRITITVTIGETEEIDIDNDGMDDISVHLRGLEIVEGRNADIIFTNLAYSSEHVREIPEIDVIVEQPIPEEGLLPVLGTGPRTGVTKQTIIALASLIGAIVFLILVLMIAYRTYKK
jgi:hypothetical protein